MLEADGRRAVVLGGERAFCCAGCEAVARTIVAAGLESYYATRTTPAATPPEVFSPAASDRDPQGNEAALILDRVRCAACLWLIEQALRRAPGVTRADVNYATQRAHVAWDLQRTRLAKIIEAVRAVGYDAYPYDPRRQKEVERHEQRAALWRLFVAGFGAMQVMMYAFPAYVDEGAGTLGQEGAQLMRWASFLLTIPVVLFSCRPFFTGAWHELRNGRLGLDTPIALGIAGGFPASAWATITGSGEVYFDSISMLTFLLLSARFMEAAARRRAARALDPLLKWRYEREVSVNEIVQIAPGERIPADGVVVTGVSSADESLLTGESRPVVKRPGDELAGGSVNVEQPLAMRVTRVGADTRAAMIACLVERAAAAKPRLVETSDRVARVLTYVVLGAALVMLLRTWNFWIPVAILVATCPCALALAAPVVLTRAGAALLGAGALLTRSRALETLDGVTDVVIDKTGTLTAGHASIARFVALGKRSEKDCLALAAALESGSRHPLALAFAHPGQLKAEGLRNFPGEGMEGRVGGRRVRIGTPGFCGELFGRASAPGNTGNSSGTQVFLADEKGWLCAFDLVDELRPNAAALILELEKRNLSVHLLSGDSADAVAAVAARLGIARFSGAMKPQDKLAYVERLQSEGKVVAVIADGLNDAPVLARADISFAMGGGAELTQLQADVVLMNDSLEKILQTFGVAQRTMRLVRQNLAWALAYNAVALPLAAAGWIGPWEAALGMGASSLVVLFNALRPLSGERTWKASTSSYPSPLPSYS